MSAARFVAVLAAMSARALVSGAAVVIEPGAIWRDDRGLPIQAHGGGITRVGDTYFWFGEDRSRNNDPAKRFVACYASKDLAHWTFRNQVLKLGDPEGFGPKWILERPKVFHNEQTGKFVMYMHVDGPVPGQAGGYRLARVATAISDSVDGDYRYIRSFRPLGQESRDIGQFVDDDGSAYLIFESRPAKGFFIAKLSSDYLDVEKEICLVKTPLEAGAIVHYRGLYYAVGSALTGWRPNPNQYATAPALAGPWSKFKDIAPPATKTYGSQSTMLLKVVGSKTTTVLFLADIWRPRTLWDSRYLWMPLQIGGGILRLPPPRAWTIDVTTGETFIAAATDRGAGQSAVRRLLPRLGRRARGPGRGESARLHRMAVISLPPAARRSTRPSDFPGRERCPDRGEWPRRPDRPAVSSGIALPLRAADLDE